MGLAAIYALLSQGLILFIAAPRVLNFAQGAFAAGGRSLLDYELHNVRSAPTTLAVVGALAVERSVRCRDALRGHASTAPCPASHKVDRHTRRNDRDSTARYIWFQSGLVIQLQFILPTFTVTPVHGATVGVDQFILLGIAVVVSVGTFSGSITRLYTLRSRFTTAAENVMCRPVCRPLAGSDCSGELGSRFSACGRGRHSDCAEYPAFLWTILFLLIIPALAAGLVAGFQSFPIALAASLVLGITQSELAHNISAPGWNESAPFLLVIVILVIRGRSLPLRSHVNEVLPQIGDGLLRIRPLLLGLGAFTAFVLISPATWADNFITSITGAIICISLVVLTGYAGQLSLAQFAFAGFSAFVAGRTAAVFGVPFLAALVIGVVAAVPVGIIVGLPALRTRGVNLAIVTFGLAFALQNVLFDNSNYTGGFLGTTVKPASLFGWDVDGLNHPKRYAIVCLVALLAVGLVAGNLRRGRSGRRLVAVRSNERAAASLGISVFGAKLYAFAVSAAIAGLGGVLLAFDFPSVDYTQFSVFQSIDVVIYTVIGGVGYIVGGLIAGLTFAGGIISLLVSTITSSATAVEWTTLVLAALLIPTLINYPNGLAAALSLQLSQFRLRWTTAVRSRGQTTPETFPRLAVNGIGQKAHKVTVMEGVARVVERRLNVEDVHVHFGGVRALSGVSLEVGPGEVVGLMGPNGAGKTTMIDAITGFARVSSGSIFLDGEHIDGLSPHQRAAPRSRKVVPIPRVV